jgi:glycosyltransferase involved in cell wall biosynthesis
MIRRVVELSVVIPAYNEAAAIGPVLAELDAVLRSAGLEHELLVVDDGSTDGTQQSLAALAGSMPALRVINHPRNRGYGAALKTGVAAARAPLVAITDADGTYPASALPGLVATLVERGADMVVGARTGANVHIPLLRRPAKAVLAWLAQYLSGNEIPDLNSGLRVFRRESAIERFHLISDGFSFTTTITLALLARNRPVVFVPVDYMRRTGSSKIRPIADTFNFLVLILRVSVYFEPLKVFLPASGLLAVFGLAYGAVQVVAGNLGEAPVLLLVSALQVLLVGLIADMISRRH